MPAPVLPSQKMHFVRCALCVPVEAPGTWWGNPSARKCCQQDLQIPLANLCGAGHLNSRLWMCLWELSTQHSPLEALLGSAWKAALTRPVLQNVPCELGRSWGLWRRTVLRRMVSNCWGVKFVRDLLTALPRVLLELLPCQCQEWRDKGPAGRPRPTPHGSWAPSRALPSPTSATLVSGLPLLGAFPSSPTTPSKCPISLSSLEELLWTNSVYTGSSKAQPWSTRLPPRRAVMGAHHRGCCEHGSEEQDEDVEEMSEVCSRLSVHSVRKLVALWMHLSVFWTCFWFVQTKSKSWVSWVIILRGRRQLCSSSSPDLNSCLKSKPVS